jgi:hypothetical protein
MGYPYNTGATELADGTVAFLTDTIKAMLVTSSYTPDKDNDVVDAGGANDPVDHELTGTGYVAGWGNSGRKTLASKTITVDKTNDRVVFDCADIAWTAIDAGTAARMLIVKEGGANDTTSRLIFNVDGGDFPVTTNGGDVTVVIPSTGLAYQQN